jgi:hypothetical protein
VSAIKAKTDALPSDPADQSAVEAAITTAAMTAAGIRTAVGLASANLDTQLAKLDTIDDFLDTEVAAIKVKTDNLPSDPADQSAVEAAITAATSPLATAVNLATLDTVADAILALLDDARTEPGQGAPPVSADMATKVDYLYKLMRNKLEQTSTELKVYADNGSTVDHKATVSDDGTTYTRGELATGA